MPGRISLALVMTPCFSKATLAWSSLHHDDLSVLLRSTTPPLDVRQLPLLTGARQMPGGLQTRLAGRGSRGPQVNLALVKTGAAEASI